MTYDFNIIHPPHINNFFAVDEVRHDATIFSGFDDFDEYANEEVVKRAYTIGKAEEYHPRRWLPTIA